MSNPLPISVTVNDAIKLTGVKRTKAYELIAAGVWRSFKVGKRRLVDFDSLRQWKEQQIEDQSV